MNEELNPWNPSDASLVGKGLCPFGQIRDKLRANMYVCDLSLILAIAGLLFVIIDAELTALSPTTHITKEFNSIFPDEIQ
ncbi:hypothetical protein ANCCAN_15188 [Ancylostoma caninum]|uniref:Uncharacterized protein n=1 Tax=Ancylostoma caninum TaxID=29170 RepID=A0A368G384_ANCCA|nr:hypothetical protein ANCCAN_15188 [Ancylostoma caninum]